MWFSIHFIAQDYPSSPSEEDAVAYRSFFENLWRVLPCYKCGVNYKRHLLELPIDEHLHSREALFAWTVALHNIVNRDLGKPQMSLEEAKKKYSDPDFNRKVCEAQQVLDRVMQSSPTNQPPILPNTPGASSKPQMMMAWIILAFVVGISVGVTVMILKRKKR